MAGRKYESRADRKARLLEAGRFADFVAFKRGLTDSGLTASEASERAVVVYRRPEDGDGELVASEAPRQFTVEFTEVVHRELMLVRARVEEAVDGADRREKVGFAPHMARARSEKSCIPGLQRPVVDFLGREAEAKEEEAVYERLIRLVLGRDSEAKPAGKLAQIDWVLANLDVPLDEILAEGVPDTGAVALLKWARGSSAMRTEFITKIYVKTVPTRSQITADADTLEDDGRSVDRLIRDFKRERGRSDAVLPTGSEGSGG